MKLISLNIEKDKHVMRVIDFLTNQSPDIACFQEIPRHVFERLRQHFKWNGFFTPMLGLQKPVTKNQDWGVAILSPLPLSLLVEDYYDAFTKDYGPFGHERNERPRAVVLAVNVPGLDFPIATTHFTWAPDGGVTQEQRVNVVRLLDALKKYPELVLCGDFNAPRGTEIFSILAKNYIDTIPKQIETTLDENLHRAGKLTYVVDGLFTTTDVKIRNVQVVCGVSDHCAIVAQVDRI